MVESSQPRDVERQAGHEKPGDAGFRWFLIIISYALFHLTFPFTFFLYFRIVQQYERAVIFRLGRLKPGGAKGPGLFFIVPCLDEYRKVDLRVVSFQACPPHQLSLELFARFRFPPQEILSKDSVTVSVDAVVYFRIYDATVSIVNVENATGSTRLLAQTTLRTILGTKLLAEMLSHRDEISAEMQSVLDQATEPWGVKVSRVEVKDISLPKQLQRAMAAEAEASREAKAKVIAANGESGAVVQASEALRSAAQVLGTHPAALQLRYLQTLNTISAEHNSTILFPLPMDLISSFLPHQFIAHQHPQQHEEGAGGDFQVRSIHSSAQSGRM
ncbi:PHB domain-containing protein [Aphelenchoides fujianensis]|nr:PHB domain-containing protein [Aphelenchoides fujianensis]